MSLEIGINEGYVLSPESAVTEKGGFKLVFSKGEVATSALDLLQAEEPEGEVASMLLFPPNMKKYGEDTLRAPIDLMRDLRATYKIMYSFFNLYFTKDELSKKYPVSVLFTGLEITPENEGTMLQQEAVINKMFVNLCNAAATFIKVEKLNEKEPFRFKLLRQSANKAYPRFTYKPEYGVWVELMSIPKEQSKVEFTPYEISKGYNDASIPSDTIDPASASEEAEAFEESGDTIPEIVPDDEVDFN